MPPRLGAALAIVFWGISFVATKAALRELSPPTLIVSRFAIGVVLLLAIVALRGLPIIPPRETWPQLALMGFIGVFVHQMVQVYGLSMTTAVHTGWLIGVTPIWSALLAAYFLRERLGATKIVGLVIGFTGAILVVTKGDFSAATLRLPSARGDLLVLATTVNWAIYTVIGHKTIRRLGSLSATASSMFAGWLMLVPIAIARRGWRELPHLSPIGWTALLFLGICCSGLGYLFWYGALERIEASKIAAFLYAEPLVTVAAAALLLHEPIAITTVIGGLLVLAGVVTIQAATVKSEVERVKSEG